MIHTGHNYTLKPHCNTIWHKACLPWTLFKEICKNWNDIKGCHKGDLYTSISSAKASGQRELKYFQEPFCDRAESDQRLILFGFIIIFCY